jgi:membrane protein
LAFLGFVAQEQAGLLPLLRWPALFVLLMAGLAVLYRFGPSRRQAKWRWLSVGSVFAALTWIAVSVAFSWYLSRFADYNATYGSLGAVIGLMMWMWISTTVVLVGAELNSEIEHQTARDSTVGPAKPLGARGAVMADTVGAAQE